MAVKPGYSAAMRSMVKRSLQQSRDMKHQDDSACTMVNSVLKLNYCDVALNNLSTTKLMCYSCPAHDLLIRYNLSTENHNTLQLCYATLYYLF